MFNKQFYKNLFEELLTKGADPRLLFLVDILVNVKDISPKNQTVIVTRCSKSNLRKFKEKLGASSFNFKALDDFTKSDNIDLIIQYLENINDELERNKGHSLGDQATKLLQNDALNFSRDIESDTSTLTSKPSAASASLSDTTVSKAEILMGLVDTLYTGDNCKRVCRIEDLSPCRNLLAITSWIMADTGGDIDKPKAMMSLVRDATDRQPFDGVLLILAVDSSSAARVQQFAKDMQAQYADVAKGIRFRLAVLLPGDLKQERNDGYLSRMDNPNVSTKEREKLRNYYDTQQGGYERVKNMFLSCSISQLFITGCPQYHTQADAKTFQRWASGCKNITIVTVPGVPLKPEFESEMYGLFRKSVRVEQPKLGCRADSYITPWPRSLKDETCRHELKAEGAKIFQSLMEKHFPGVKHLPGQCSIAYVTFSWDKKGRGASSESDDLRGSRFEDYIKLLHLLLAQQALPTHYVFMPCSDAQREEFYSRKRDLEKFFEDDDGREIIVLCPIDKMPVNVFRAAISESLLPCVTGRGSLFDALCLGSPLFYYVCPDHMAHLGKQLQEMLRDLATKAFKKGDKSKSLLRSLAFLLSHPWRNEVVDMGFENLSDDVKKELRELASLLSKKLAWLREGKDGSRRLEAISSCISMETIECGMRGDEVLETLLAIKYVPQVEPSSPKQHKRRLEADDGPDDDPDYESDDELDDDVDDPRCSVGFFDRDPRPQKEIKETDDAKKQDGKTPSSPGPSSGT